MSRWIKVAVPLGIAAVLVSVLAIGFGSQSIDAAPGGNGRGNGNHKEPTIVLTPNPHAEVGQWIVVTGEGFPKDTAVAVVITQVSPVYSSLIPTLGVETDRSGSFETGTSFDEPGIYAFSACFYKHRGWDCQSTTPKTVEVAE